MSESDELELPPGAQAFARCSECHHWFWCKPGLTIGVYEIPDGVTSILLYVCPACLHERAGEEP